MEPSQAPELVVEEDMPFEASLTSGDVGLLHRLLGGALQVRGSSFVVARTVGHVVLPSGRVLRIRSKKAPAASVLAWTAYVDPSLGELRILGEVDHATQEADVGALLARLFFSELARVLGVHGLARAYQRTGSVSAVVRGRIDFAGLARRAGDASRVPCVIWERRPQTPAMRMLAATIDGAAADPVMRAVDPSRLRSLRAAFGEVVPDVDPALLAGRTELARNEQAFSPAIALARLILRHLGLGEGAEHKGLSYLIGLDGLFEQAVVRALRENGVDAIPKHPIRHQRVGALGDVVFGASPMELDALCPGLVPGGVVVDAKYKDRISSGNLQQLIAYCTLTGARQGVLAVPAGLIHDKRSYRFEPHGTEPVTVHIVELAVHGKNVATWRAAASEFAAKMLAVCVGVGSRIEGTSVATSE